MAEAIVSMVVGRITDLLIEEPQLFQEVRDEIQLVVTELMRMKTFLRDADSRIYEEKVHILLAEVRDLAYDAEHAVESFLVKALSPGKAIQWMNTRKFSRKIKDIQRVMSLLFNQFDECNIRSTSKTPESSSYETLGKLKRFHTFTIVEPDIFVGFEGDVDCLVGHLVDESDNSYPLISICGMGGLGKTTLAQKIYNHATVKTYFAGLAWVSISQKWQTKQVLQRILIGLVHEKKEEIFTWDDDKLLKNLLQIQQEKKCLVVLDDIWSKDAWDSLKAAFTSEKSISKLMLTSRKDDVAEYVNAKGLIHRQEFLSPGQSWELLRLKALPPGGDALDITRDVKRMEELGREMVRNCAGLPLAIVTLGGVLVTKPSLIEWEKVHDDIASSQKRGKGLEQDYQSQILDVLLWSYNDLPPQLKPCFLYLGKFLEDEWIDAENLYQLWIAEGIVLSSDKGAGETMMQVAESYMGELVHRSMVQVRFNDSLTKFKSCSLHDLMRDLSLSQARAVDFCEAIDIREGNDFHHNRSVVSRVANTRQLVVYCESKFGGNKANSYFTKKPNHQQYRSFLLLNMCGSYSEQPRLGPYFANFKLLRVLALENLWHRSQSDLGTSFGTEIGRILGSLVYLRYLSLRGSPLETFGWVQKLVLLQTLKLDSGSFTYIPPVLRNILGKLTHLRHLYLPYRPDWRDDANSWNDFKVRFNGLSKLETLENFDTKWCEVKDLPKLSSLCRLKLSAEGGYDDVKEMFKYLSDRALSSNSCIQYLTLVIKTSYPGFRNEPDMIRQLFWNHKFNPRKLKIDGYLPELSEIFKQQLQQLDHTHIRASFNGITNLELVKSDLNDDPMPVLEMIPTLRELVLANNAYVGHQEMVCSATGFQKLTRLEFSALYYLQKWRVEKGGKPILQHLKLSECGWLKELPEGLIFLKSLRELVLVKMPEFCNRVLEQGPDFHKIAYVPDIITYRY